jgi:hypothetical protein
LIITILTSLDNCYFPLSVKGSQLTRSTIIPTQEY